MIVLQVHCHGHLFTIVMKCLEHALRVYRSGSDSEFRNCEIARFDFKLAEVLQQLGKYEEADQHLKKSTELHRSLVGNAFILDTKEGRYT